MPIRDWLCPLYRMVIRFLGSRADLGCRAFSAGVFSSAASSVCCSVFGSVGWSGCCCVCCSTGCSVGSVRVCGASVTPSSSAVAYFSSFFGVVGSVLVRLFMPFLPASFLVRNPLLCLSLGRVSPEACCGATFVGAVSCCVGGGMGSSVVLRLQSRKQQQGKHNGQQGDGTTHIALVIGARVIHVYAKIDSNIIRNARVRARETSE